MVSVHGEALRHPQCLLRSAWLKSSWAETRLLSLHSGARSQRALDLSNWLPATCLGKNSMRVEVPVRVVPLSPARRGEQKAPVLTAVPLAGRWWASWVPTGPDPGKGGIGLKSGWERGQRTAPQAPPGIQVFV